MVSTCAGARVAAAFLLVTALAAGTVGAQPQSAPAPQAPASPLPSVFQAAVLSAERSGEPFTLTYFNRPIVVLRAAVLGRPPAERAVIAVRVLDNLVAANATDPVESRSIEGGSLIFVGSRVVVGLAQPDIDELAGETLEDVTALTVARLRQAFDEAKEAHTPAELIRAGVAALVAVAIGLLALWVLARSRRSVSAKLVAVSESTVAKAGLAAAQPVVLVLDDLQWAAPLLLDLLEHLVQWSTGVPLLVLAAARPDLREARSALVMPGRVATDVVRLDTARRREEIARMLAGSTVTDEARAAADRLIVGAA